MTIAKHTPGPWKATRSNPAEGVDVWWISACTSSSMEKDICYVPGGADTQGANAELIALVPELLTALHAVMWMAEEWYKHNGCDATCADEYSQEIADAKAILDKVYTK